MKQTMSLHRIIAEIKALEAKLLGVASAAFIYQATGEDALAQAADLKVKSQSEFDSFSAAIKNLATLKSARNTANATTKVVIGGVTMTIDEALAQKAVVQHKMKLSQTLQAQFINGQRVVDQAQAQIDARVQQQMASMFAGTKKATEDEIKMVRNTVERNAKVTLLHADTLKNAIERINKEVTDFTTEVDYVLSEANATAKVDVELV